MKQINTEELKQIQLNILDRIHTFCVEHGINYSLSSGSLIGAVRHKGYIPWDDDIDIYMLKPDYNRFEAEFSDKYFKIISPWNCKDCIFPFAKVYDSRTLLIEDVDNYEKGLGVNIDIFQVDSVPDDIRKRKRLFRWNSILDSLMILKITRLSSGRAWSKNVLLFIGKIFLLCIPVSFIVKRKIYLVRNFNPNAKDICNVMAGGGINVCLPMEVMKNFIDIEFEGNLFKCMADYDLYLRKNYGDYMQLPPAEERTSHHSFKAYWK